MGMASRSVAVALIVFLPLTTFAHGLTFTTAWLTLRQQNHLSLRLELDPLMLLKGSENNTSSFSLLQQLSTLDEPSFAEEYREVTDLIRNGVEVQFSGNRIDSFQWRFPSADQLRDLLRKRFMAMVIAQQKKAGGDAGHFHNRDDHMTVFAEGFLPKDLSTGPISFAFPRALGTTVVSYAEPITKTIQPAGN